MRKSFQLLILIVLVFSLPTGCGSLQSQQSSQITNEPKLPAQAFAAGTWFVKSQDTAAYYFFDTDGVSGRTSSLENGMGVGFTYAVDGTNVLFHMGAADNETKATVTFTDESNAELTWADGQKETMHFVSEKDSEVFKFYSNWELCTMAVSYYTQKTADAAPDAAANLEPEVVTIQLYHKLGDHNSTCAWYRVNRMSGKGIDVSSGSEIDLTALHDEPINQD